MKKILPIALLFSILLSGKIQAQDEAIFNHYLVNPILVNPAYAGFSDNHQIFAHYHTQWTGYVGEPRTFAFSYNGAISERIGLGATLFTERAAAIERLRGQISYAYRYVGKEMKFSFGFSTEFQRIRLNSDVTSGFGYNPSDQTVTDAIKGTSYFDAAVGGVLELNGATFIGISSPNMIRARLGSIAGVNKPDSTSSTLFKQFVFWAGHKYKKEQYSIEPSIQIRKVYEAPFEVDFNVKAAILADKLIFGVTFRPGSSGVLSLMVGTKQEGLRLYYSYNSSFADIKTYNGNAHEVTLGFEINKGEKKLDRKKKYRN
jgi:type IX secretion system PorP/SprF family membrane protein